MFIQFVKPIHFQPSKPVILLILVKERINTMITGIKKKTATKTNAGDRKNNQSYLFPFPFVPFIIVLSSIKTSRDVKIPTYRLIILVMSKTY